MIYRLSGSDVAQLGVRLRPVAEEHLVELRVASQQMMAEPDRLAQVGRKELLAQARRGEVVVLDVRSSRGVRRNPPAPAARDKLREGAKRSTPSKLAHWTAAADKVLVF